MRRHAGRLHGHTDALRDATLCWCYWPFTPHIDPCFCCSQPRAEPGIPWGWRCLPAQPRVRLSLHQRSGQSTSGSAPQDEERQGRENSIFSPKIDVSGPPGKWERLSVFAARHSFCWTSVLNCPLEKSVRVLWWDKDSRETCVST